MISFFSRTNIIFCVKIAVLSFLGVTYYIFSTIIKSQTRSDYLAREAIADEAESIYKQSLEIYLNISRELANFEDFEYQKKVAINTNSTLIYNGEPISGEKSIKAVYYEMKLPGTDNLNFPKFGNLLMPIVSEATSDSSTIEYKFNELYNGDSCLCLFPQGKGNSDYDSCSVFWNGILTKGMEQAMTQMSVSITSVLDELKDYKSGNETDLTQLFRKDSEFFMYETFMENYFYNSFLQSSQMFDILRTDFVDNIKSKFNVLLILYCVVAVLLFLLILFFIYTIKNDFNSFLNFIVIFPLKFLAEDEYLYKHTLLLDDNLF